MVLSGQKDLLRRLKRFSSRPKDADVYYVKDRDVFMKLLNKIEAVICATIRLIVGVIVFFMVGINVLQVVTRYFVDKVITWIEDVSILSVLCIAALGVSYAWLKGEHLIMDITDELYPVKLKKALWIICQLVAVVAGVKLAQLGIYNAELNLGVKATGLRYDESLRYIPLIVCGVLLAVAAVINLAKEWVTHMNKEGNGGGEG